MAAALVLDGLWDVIEPLLSLPKPKPHGGRPRLPDRACLRGILFVLRSGIPWEMLPKELGCGSGMTCWRRLGDWQESGIWQLIHFVSFFTKGGPSQILRKIFLRYIQNRMNQKISITAKPWSAG